MQQTYFKTSTFQKEDPKIFDKNNFANIGLLYWQQETLEEIAKLSGPLAVANEFQIHYWALVVRLKFTDESLIDIGFPTTIFNYIQEVSSSHIDFELKDVSKMSEALKPIHNVVTNQLLPKLQEIFVGSEHYKVEFLSVPLNTMHRHPTGVASFSGTDLKKDHEYNTGIVFPLKTGNNTPTFSSIIYNNPVKLIHTEYRTATGDTATEGIFYEKGRCATFIKDKISVPSMAERFLGHKPVDKSYLVDKTNIADIYPLLEVINKIEYTPNTQFIKANNLSKKSYSITVTKTQTKTMTVTEKKKDTLPLEYDDATKKLVEDATGLTLIEAKVLETMTIPQLRLHLLSFEQYYYEDLENITVTDYVYLNKEEMIENIIEIQNLIVDELDHILSGNDPEIDSTEDVEPSLEYMRKTLISFGAPKEDIDKAPDITIKNWFTELTLYDEAF